MNSIHRDRSARFVQIMANTSTTTEYSNIVGIDDLSNSPEFMEEQLVLLLQFEEAKHRSQDELSRGAESSQRRECRPSRRSSIGTRFSCPVCHESLASAGTSNVNMVTECGHVFCQSCIVRVCGTAIQYSDSSRRIRHRASCPVCRKPVGELRKVYI